MLPQHFVDTRLPARSGSPEARNHGRIEPQAYQMLGGFQAWSAKQAALYVGCVGGGRRPHPGESFFVDRLSVRVGERRLGARAALG